MQRSLAQLALQLQSQQVLGSSLSICARALSTSGPLGASSHATDSTQTSQPQAQTPSLTHVPSVQSLLVKSSAAGPLAKLAGSLGTQAIRPMAGGPGVSPITTENTWQTFREQNGLAKRNDLGQAMYAMILTFGFGYMLNDLAGYPPRVITIMAFTFAVLYTRKF